MTSPNGVRCIAAPPQRLRPQYLGDTTILPIASLAANRLTKRSILSETGDDGRAPAGVREGVEGWQTS